MHGPDLVLDLEPIKSGPWLAWRNLQPERNGTLLGVQGLVGLKSADVADIVRDAMLHQLGISLSRCWICGPADYFGSACVPAPCGADATTTVADAILPARNPDVGKAIFQHQAQNQLRVLAIRLLLPRPLHPNGGRIPDPQLNVQLRQQSFKPASMPLASIPTRTLSSCAARSR